MASKRIILITGEPGVGKTTLIRKLYDELVQHHNVGGFFTEEVRQPGAGRVGFDIVTLEQHPCRAELARKGAVSRHFVGQYAVYTDRLEQTVLPVLDDLSKHKILIIDEIGKMELKSRKFAARIAQVFEASAAPVIIATVPLKSAPGLKFVDDLKCRTDADLYTVTFANRTALFGTILNHIKQLIN